MIHDYDRVDAKTGEKRELHNELAIDVIDFKVHDSYKTTYELKPNISNKLVHSPYFKTNIVSIEGEVKKDYSDIDSFVIYICVEGVLDINYKGETYLLSQGETIMFPSSITSLVLNATNNVKILEVYF